MVESYKRAEISAYLLLFFLLFLLTKPGLSPLYIWLEQVVLCPERVVIVPEAERIISLQRAPLRDPGRR